MQNSFTADITFARIGAAAAGMEVRDLYLQNRRLWVWLHEKGAEGE